MLLKKIAGLSCCALSLLFCCVIATPSYARPAGGEIRWKLATLAPKGVGWAQHIEHVLLPAIDQATDNALQMKWYWGGIMGDDEDFIKKMRINQLQGMGFSGQGITIACPAMAVIELPFLFENADEVDHIKNTMRSDFDALLADSGFVLLHWVDQDFDQIYSVQMPFDSVEDFKHSKFLTWYGPLEEKLLARLGASPIPVNVPEVATSVRQGIVDSMVAPAIWMVGSQMYGVVKFINPVHIRYSPAGLLVTLDAWEGLEGKHREEILKSRTATENKFNVGLRSDNKKAIEAMVKYGVHLVEMKPDDLADLKKSAVGVWDEVTGDLFPEELLEKMLSELDDFRADAPN